MTRAQKDRDEDLALGRELERKDAEIDWYRSGFVTLKTLAAAKGSPLTNENVDQICERMLTKYQVS